MAALAAAAVSAISSASIPTILSVVGTGIGALGAIQQGRSAEASANYQAQQLEQKAGQDRATAQRRAMEERRQGRLMASRVQALAGGGGTDPGILGLTGDIAGEGEYNALASLYEGEESALGRESQAAGARAEGKAAKSAGYIRAASTIFSGASSMYGKYGGGGLGGSSGDGLSQGARRKIGVF